jgi:hypothetical protein
VRLRIAGLDADENRARLVAEWALLTGGDPGTEITRRLSRNETSLAPERPRGDAVAEAYSDLLYQLSEEIAAAIRAAQSPEAG